MSSPKIERNSSPYSNSSLHSNLNEMDINGRNTLHLLAMEGNSIGLQEILNSCSHIDLEMNDNNGQTPLNIAARQGYIDVVEVLIKKNIY